MKLDFPRYTERIGSVCIHGIQKIYEMDSGKIQSSASSEGTIRSFDNMEISNILHELAIILPIKDEKLKLLEGVLSGIPNECLVILVSNSQRTPVDRYAMELDMIKQYSRFVSDKKMVIVHQKDQELGNIFKKIKYESILSDGSIRDGKGEAMVIGMVVAKMYLKQYVGFIDADNYVPGAVNEYAKIFAAGFGMTNTPYANVRVSWSYKPKIRDNVLLFAKSGRTSEITNKYLNKLISYITGFETEIVKTGNAGEHALTMALAENLHFSSGYSVETYEFIDIFEKFGGLIPSIYPEIVEKGVEVFQIETRNPHFHEDKGTEHLFEMTEGSLISILSSKICHENLSKEIRSYISETKNSKISKKKLAKIVKMEPINTIQIDKFADLINNSNILQKFG